MCGLDIIKNFSEMHKLHRLVRVVYALAFARIFHVILAKARARAYTTLTKRCNLANLANLQTLEVYISCTLNVAVRQPLVSD